MAGDKTWQNDPELAAVEPCHATTTGEDEEKDQGDGNCRIWL